ncbi:MAG: C4-type zinc ribbon domain-containing protein [Myxococcota bacterium]
MNKTIEGLIDLQRIDDEIRTVRKERDELAQNLDRLQKIVAKMGVELTEKREKLAEVTKFHDEKKLELTLDNDRIQVAKQKLLGVNRTKEYQAMTKELDNLRKKHGEDEAELERLAAAIQEYRTSVQAQEVELADIQAEVEREQATSASRLAELEKAIAVVAEKKSGLKQVLPKDILAKYERVLERRDGVAVVAVVQGRCTGCRMALPPQTWVKVQIGKEIFQCASCQRYLYYTVQASQAQMQ